jgi:hypothetical protein
LERIVAHAGSGLDALRDFRRPAGWPYLPGTEVRLSPFAQTNRVPTSVPNLFLVTTAATHCAYSLVPIVPSVPMSQKSIAPPPGYIANSKHTEHWEHNETQGD